MAENDATQNPSASPLRRQAEAKARELDPQALEALSPEAARQALHELRVHRIELEMQNEALRQTQTELELSRARYIDLYDLAPVGYVTLGEPGLILEANLTAASLLGVARGALVTRLLTRFILKEDQGLYYQHRKELFETGAPQRYELRMVVRHECSERRAGSTRDEGAPLGAAIQVEASNHRKLLWSKAMVVSVTEKAEHDSVRCV